jgi:hypothetical protein
MSESSITFQFALTPVAIKPCWSARWFPLNQYSRAIAKSVWFGHVKVRETILPRIQYFVEKPAWRAGTAWCGAIALGFAHGFAARYSMNPDGIAYLNIASLYEQGHWSSAINGYWSPAYPFLLACMLRLISAGPFFESTTVHGLNFLLYLASFAAFRFFLSEMRMSQQQDGRTAGTRTHMLTFRPAAETACAYALFFWATLVLIGLGNVTPDLAIATEVFLVSGLAIRFQRGTPAFGYVALGALLGLAYLTKAVMFPIGIVMALSCGFPAKLRIASERATLAVIGFLCVATPQIFAMSRLAGHVSYGESGKLAYATEVNHLPMWWTGQPKGTGTPVHPVRQINQEPAAYEFGWPNKSLSYPLWDETAYWRQGAGVQLRIDQQMAVTKPILNHYEEFLDVLLFACMALYLMRNGRIRAKYAALVIPGIAVFAIYALVYAETRYLGAWVVVLFLGFAASLRFGPDGIRGAKAIAAALAVFYGATVMNQSRYAFGEVTKSILGRPPEHAQFEVAAKLADLGVHSGSNVAVIGDGHEGYWARLAQVQISMECPGDDVFWSASDSAKGNLIREFREHGATAVVANRVPDGGPDAGWQPLGPKGYFFLRLGSPSSTYPEKP